MDITAICWFMVVHADHPSNTHIYADTVSHLYHKIRSSNMPLYIRQIWQDIHMYILWIDIYGQ